MSRSITFLLGGAVGAAAMYFLDPRSGAARRDQASDQAAEQARTAAATAEQAVEKAQEVAADAGDSTPVESGPPNAPDLKDRIESEIFRDANAPKGQVSVNVENEVVVLRGELESEALIAEMEERTRAVEGVTEVRNLLHLPGEPAPGAPGVPEEPLHP